MLRAVVHVGHKHVGFGGVTITAVDACLTSYRWMHPPVWVDAGPIKVPGLPKWRPVTLEQSCTALPE